MPQVSSVDVDFEAGSVTVEGEAQLSETLRDALLRLGYPERGSASGISAVGAKAKSFVSCAIGRFSD